MMKTPIRVLLLLVAVVTNCFGGSQVPESFANAIRRIESFYTDGAPTTSRIELLVVSPNRFIDPAPTAENFQFKANVVVAVDAPSAHDVFTKLAKEIETSGWKKISAPGYPRCCWRLVDGSGKVVAGFLIDEERGIICVDGQWFHPESKSGVIRLMTTEFIDFATKELLAKTVKR